MSDTQPRPGSGRGPFPDGTFVPAIQGLRGLAALSVMVVHLHLMPLAAGLWVSGFPEWLREILGTGGRGVELFFVISGYLIPASLRRHGRIGRFLFERAMRIMPLFVVLHLVVFVVGPWIGYKFLAGIAPLPYLAAFAANLTFLAPLVGVPLAQQNAWSLTYEWLFYLWTAAAFLGWRSRTHRFALAPLLMIAAATIVTFPATSYFALGVAFSAIHPPRFAGRIAGLALGLASLAAMYALCEYVSPFAGLPFAAILFALVLDPGSGFAALLRGRGVGYLGRVSYSLYLVHPFVLYGLLLAVRRSGLDDAWPGLAGPTVFVVGGIASVAAAGLTHTIVEVRLRRWLEGLRLRPGLPPVEGLGRTGPDRVPS